MRGQQRLRVGPKGRHPIEPTPDHSRGAKHGEDCRDTGSQPQRVLPGAMHDLRRRGITQLQTGRDIGERAVFHRGLPEREALAQCELAQQPVDEVAIHDAGLEIGARVPIGAECDKGPPEAPPPAQHIDTVILGDGQQPGAGTLRFGVGRQ